MHGEMRKAYKILARKPGVKILLGRPTRTRKDTIKMNLKDTRCGDVNWIRLSQDRVH